MGKVLETIIGQRIANAIEEYHLFLEGQIGNKRGRSIELAIRMVVEAARIAWEYDIMASLLQLDIKGAYDRVNHVLLRYGL